MPRLRYSATARANFIQILAHISVQTGDERTGRRYVEKLRARCLELSRLPGTMGRSRADLSSELRSSVLGNHVIFFRYVGAFFEIVAVLEGHRDMDDYFGTHQ